MDIVVVRFCLSLSLTPQFQCVTVSWYYLTPMCHSSLTRICHRDQCVMFVARLPRSEGRRLSRTTTPSMTRAGTWMRSCGRGCSRSTGCRDTRLCSVWETPSSFPPGLLTRYDPPLSTQRLIHRCPSFSRIYHILWKKTNINFSTIPYWLMVHIGLIFIQNITIDGQIWIIQ